MKNAIRQEVEAFASKIVRTYFCDSDLEFMISTFAPDIVWIGGGEKMQAEGCEEVAAIFRSGKENMIPCDLYSENLTTRKLSEDCYLCVEDCWLEPKPGTKMFFKVHERLTFVFRRIENSFETVHIHNSVPFSAIKDDELFPAEAAREAYEKLKSDLTQKDQQIELMLSQLPGGIQICRIDFDFSTKWISQSLRDMLGYSSDEEYVAYTHNCCRGLLCPEDYDNMYLQVTKDLKKGNSYHAEYRIKKKNGTLMWVADFGKKVTDVDGEEVIYCFISDITDRKNKELLMLKTNMEVKQQAKFLSQLYNSIPCGILQFTTGPNPTVVSINRAGWEFYGFISEEHYRSVVKDPFQMVLKEDRKRIEKLIHSLTIDGPGSSYTRKGKRINGSYIWVSVVMERLVNADGIEVIQSVYTDITKTKTLQIAREQESLIENHSLRAAICTAYPLILSVNLTKNSFNCFIEESRIYLPEALKTFDELVEESIPMVYPSYQNDYISTFSRSEIIKRFALGEREIYMEFKQKGIDNAYHWISLHLIYVENPINTDVLAIELVKVLDNQRSEKARQEQLLRDALASARAASNAKSDFLSRMSHDIRTPMNAIVGMSTIGQLKINDTVRVYDCFKKIDASSRYLLALINDILDMSKIETGKMTIVNEQFDLTTLISNINSIIYPQAIEQGIDFEIHHTEPIAQYYTGDLLRTKQILMNLLSNALKFTPEGGRIIIDIKEQKHTSGYTYLCFTVSDNGIGMSDEFLSRIFQPFEQESSEIARNNIGSGLGLSIVYNLVQLMSGTIEVNSKKGEGTSFTVTLPFGIVSYDKNLEEKGKSMEILAGLEVLVADDDEIVGEQTTAILDKIGAHSVFVNSGFQAVEEVRRSLSTGKTYDIAMIDWRMPDMDGLETTKEIRKLAGPDTMIIIISAYDWSNIEGEAKAAGANCFIAKPLFGSAICDTFMQLTLNHPKSIPDPKQDFHFSGQHVLLTEDNELNLEIAKSLLEMNGIVVETAVNGQEAIKTFLDTPSNHFSAILMDIRMPVMDGLTATRTIRALDRPDARNIPIIAMTANAFDEDKALAYEAGVNDYLVKPLDIDILLQKLSDIV